LAIQLHQLDSRTNFDAKLSYHSIIDVADSVVESEQGVEVD
jgi:hypothetical protein